MITLPALTLCYILLFTLITGIVLGFFFHSMKLNNSPQEMYSYES